MRPGFHSGAHQNIKCVDCHLPNNNLVNHLFWKSVDGVKDSLAFQTGRVSETIRISACMAPRWCRVIASGAMPSSFPA